MRTIAIHPASLVIGLVLGVCVAMAMGQAPARPAAAGGGAVTQRYQISSSNADQGVVNISILDHETQKVYFSRVGTHESGLTIETLMRR